MPCGASVDGARRSPPWAPCQARKGATKTTRSNAVRIGARRPVQGVFMWYFLRPERAQLYVSNSPAVREFAKLHPIVITALSRWASPSVRHGKSVLPPGLVDRDGRGVREIHRPPSGQH